MLSDTELRAQLDREIDNAIGYLSGDITEDRADAMDYYLGRAEGDLAPPEVEGRSEVVSTDVADVIEWILPQVIKSVETADQPVRFDPMGPEDEDLADQETDYVNYTYDKRNNGFLTNYTWIKDGLLHKVGTIKTFYDEREEVSTESYSALTDMELGEVVNDPEVEVEAHEVYPDPAGSIDQMGMPVMLHDVQIKRTRMKGEVCVECIPPEEFLVNGDHTSILLDDARFTAHETVKTVSELVEMGFDFDEVKDLPSYDSDFDDEERNTLAEEDDLEESGDPSLRQIKLHDCYALVDYDQDGVAERRRVLYVKGGKILLNEPADCVPFASWTPIIMPHRWSGLSIFDRIKMIQVQKTAIWRQILDNLYLTNNQRTAIQEGRVNLDDLLNSRPGGIVRVKGNPAESVQPLQQAPIGPAGYQMLEYMDKVREERSGVGPQTMGQDIKVGNDTAHGLERLMTMKEELVALITRTFCETGYKSMMLQVHALLIKHQDKPKLVQLRNKWVQVNPAEWRERENLTIKVGLGTGDRMRQQSAAMAIVQQHNQMMQEPGQLLVTPQQRYKALVELADLSGMGNPEQYFLDPASPEAQQMAQSAQQQQMEQQQQQMQMMQMQMQLQQALAQAEQMKAQTGQMKAQIDAQKQQSSAQIDWLKLQLDQAKGAAKAAGDNEQLRFQYEKLYQDIATKITELEMGAARDLNAAHMNNLWMVQ